MKLKEIVASYRQENDISQREFARRCGLSNSLISIIEMGKNPQTGKEMVPDFNTYRKLANGMGISVQSLFLKMDDDSLVNIGGSFGNGEITGLDDFDRFMTATVPENLRPEDMEILEMIHKNPTITETVKGLVRLSPNELVKLHQMAKVMFPDAFKE